MITRQTKIALAIRILIPWLLGIAVLCALFAFVPGITYSSLHDKHMLTPPEKVAFAKAFFPWYISAIAACVLSLITVFMKAIQNTLTENNESSGYGLETIAVAIAILSLVLPFIPDFSINHGIRSPVSKMKTDMRTISTGIEAYYIDNNAYPPNLLILTTPVAYLTQIPQDMFSPNPPEQPRYHQDADGWIVWSYGPDGVCNLTHQNIRKYYDSKMTPPSNDLLNMSYDPTNGMYSSGDIWRIKQ